MSTQGSDRGVLAADSHALLSAIETCLIANDISSVRLEVDREHYLFATR